jgi:replicative DNA helicase
MSPDFSRLHSPEAEQSVIGALLLDPSAADRLGALRPDHCFAEHHRILLAQILAMIGAGKAVDAVTVAEEIHDRGLTEQTGGLAYLGELISNTPSARNVGRYAETVVGKALERQLLVASETIRNTVAGVGSTSEKLAAAQAAVMGISEAVASRAPRVMREVLLSAVETMMRREAGDIPGLKTGLEDLDGMLSGGMRPGNLIIVAGRPGMGKTSLALQFAIEAAGNNTAALFLSMEMVEQELADRMIASVGRVALDSVLASGAMNDDVGDRVQTAIGRLQELPLVIDDKGGLSLFDVTSKARSVKRKHGLGLLVIDYLQLMTGEGDNRNQQIEQITRGLKALAKELGIPVVVLSQLSRKCDDRANRRPIPSDLRESGAIEQDADVILFVYRDEVYHPESQDKGTAEIIVGKNRQGRIGMVRTAYIGEQTRFAPLAHNWAPAQSDKPFAKKRRGFDD